MPGPTVRTPGSSRNTFPGKTISYSKNHRFCTFYQCFQATSALTIFKGQSRETKKVEGGPVESRAPLFTAQGCKGKKTLQSPERSPSHSAN